MRASSRVEPDQPASAGSAHPAAAAPGGIRGLVARFEGLVRELGKFGVVGAVTFVMDTVILKLALSAGMNPLLAKTLSTTIAATAAFIGNRFWTWRDRPRSGLHREYALYFIFNVVGLGIGLACLGASHYLLGRVWPVFASQVADLISANVVGMALGTLFRFWSYRRFVFRTHSAVSRRG
ncbi:GtrA family protein [Planosporangium thailandense]|uniref:GtrA family protein n=1 Tax=Planosporangium thailandense TaxID=765197 RepID=UPI0030B7FAB3